MDDGNGDIDDSGGMDGGGNIKGGMMKKRSVSIRGHRTSLSLEDGFWEELTTIATARGLSVAALITEIDHERTAGLSSAVRLFILEDLRQRAAACRTAAAELD